MIPERESRVANVPLLKVRGLRIEAKADETWKEIVHGIGFDLRRGEVLGLIGESGAGKSTVGLAAMGYARDGCRISGGTVEFRGQDLVRASEEDNRRLRGSRIAYVAQSAAASFNPAHRLIDQYCEVPVVHGVKRRAEAQKDAVEIYRRLQLPNPEEIGFRYPHQVSGGQLQRAMTAMAMACRPDLIIFDEPTTALDVTTQIEVLAAMRNAVRQFGTAAIYISHDLAVVAQMADRIMVLRYGDVVEEADTRTMMSEPKQAYTRALWAVRSFRTEPKPTVAFSEIPIIRVDNITAAYGSATVLKNVSFDIHVSRTVAIVGESGSGKSTLARVITGLLPPLAGSSEFKGAVLPPDFRDRSRDQLRRVQLISQMPDTALNPRQKVRDVLGRPLEFYLGLRGAEREARIRALLNKIELDPDEFINRLPGELSGGQKQRVCIARALAAEPDFIICDEVTSALDQIVAEGILRLLIQLQDEFGLAYMFITHDLATVRAIADDVVVMHRGEAVRQGDKEQVLRPPYDPYTELLLSSVPEMDPDWLTTVIDRRTASSMGTGRPS
ncbi:ABC transporter ATP-binding protein [Mesorhizobium sp. BHbdii]